jgi:hypothetical protein
VVCFDVFFCVVCLSGTTCIIYFLFIYGARVEPSPLLLQPFIGLLCQPWMIDDDDCGAIGTMNEWQGNQRKPAPVPLCPPQIPYHLTRAGTRATAVGSRRLGKVSAPCLKHRSGLSSNLRGLYSASLPPPARLSLHQNNAGLSYPHADLPPREPVAFTYRTSLGDARTVGENAVGTARHSIRQTVSCSDSHLIGRSIRLSVSQ